MELTACRANGDRPLPHARESCNPDVLVAIVHQTIVLNWRWDQSLEKDRDRWVRTTSSDMTSKLNSFAMSAMASISILVNTFPTGLWGVFNTIIFVLGVTARLKKNRGRSGPRHTLVTGKLTAIHQSRSPSHVRSACRRRRCEDEEGRRQERHH